VAENDPTLTRVSSIAEVFPHDDPVARFVVSISMARNDIRHALELTAEANEGSKPEFTYYARLAMAHFFDALDALDSWCKVTEVKAFIAAMPKAGRDELRKARRTRQLVGHVAIGHARNRTLHYPSPASSHQTDGELAEALRGLGDEEATLVITGRGYYRLQFADHVALTLAMRKHTPGRFREDARQTQEGAAAYVNFATVVWRQYMRARDLEDGLPPPP